MTDNTRRLVTFTLLWIVFAALERCLPCHIGTANRKLRWPINLGLGAIGTLCLHLLMPWLVADAALAGENRHIGLLHTVHLPRALEAFVGVVVLDLSIYSQHRLMHHVPILWRLHQVHHTDTSLDVSSATRFHPAELIFSMVFKIAVVLLIGIAPTVVFLFEILLSSFALFTHANIFMPRGLECLARVFIVTPDMHRIHHSIRSGEHHTNFAFHLSLWDRMFGTYCPNPAAGQQSMALGLESFREPREQTLLRLLAMPFTNLID